MTKTNFMRWKLPQLPTAEGISHLVEQKVITAEEAREILFNLEKKSDSDEENLKGEIKFLRELIQRLSTNNTIIETIRCIEKPYKEYPWYDPYITWCSAGTVTYNITNPNLVGTDITTSFTNISTF